MGLSKDILLIMAHGLDVGLFFEIEEVGGQEYEAEDEHTITVNRKQLTDITLEITDRIIKYLKEQS